MSRLGRACMIGLAVASPLLPFATSGAEEVGRSIILNLREQSDDVRSAVLGDNGLAEKVEELRARLGVAAEETQRTYEVYKSDPTEAAALAFEDAVSRGLLRAAQGLEEVLVERSTVLAAADGLDASVRSAKKTFGARVQHYQDRAEERELQSERLYNSLEQMAERYADLVRLGHDLPPDADLAVRQAYRTWKTGEARAALYQDAGVRMEMWVEKIDKYNAALRRIRGEYELVFAQAADQERLLRDVAEVRGDEVEAAGFIRELAHVTGDILRARDGMDGVLAGIDAILNAPPLLNPEDEPDPVIDLASGQGVDILRQILDAKRGGRSES